VKSSTHHTQSATSIPRAPQDEVGSRSTRYLIMMGVRVVCFVLMVCIQPYGWYTWVFGAAAIFLPYIAVVLANVGQDGKAIRAEDPERALEAAPSPRVEPEPRPSVIRLSESPAVQAPSADAASGATPRVQDERS
jgi:hypothetical protein